MFVMETSVPEMINREGVAYAWGTKNGKRECHCFKHAMSVGLDGPGRKPWESLCLGNYKAQDLGWASDWRRSKPTDKRCPACLKMIKKLGIRV